MVKASLLNPQLILGWCHSQDLSTGEIYAEAARRQPPPLILFYREAGRLVQAADFFIHLLT